MKQNVGGYDRIVRIVLGLGGIYAGYVYALWWITALAVVVLLTGLIGWCGLYTVCQISTAKKKKTPPKKQAKTKKSKPKKKK